MTRRGTTVSDKPPARTTTAVETSTRVAAPTAPSVPSARATVRPAVISRATVSDVARLAGVSGKTVSRVVSGDGSVSPQTRQRVLDAAQRLRFRPNHLARDLRRGGVSTTVAFVMGDLRNPFYSRVAAGIERELALHDLTLLIATTGDDRTQEAAVVSALLERRVHSLLIVPIADDQSYLEGERQLGTQIVCIDRPARNLSSDCVVFANNEGAGQAVRSFLEHGHRKIGFVGSSAELYTDRERLAGYRQALNEAGIGRVARWERTDGVDTESAARAVYELLAQEDPPTAILASNNRVSTGVLMALRESPRRPAFIGFDDFDLAAFLGVTVIAHEPETMGREAVRMAMAREGDPGGPPIELMLPTKLIRRGSGELAPPADA